MHRYGLMIAFIVISVLVSRLGVQSTALPPKTESSSLVEESMSGVTLVRFDKSGVPHESMTLESWEHKKGDDITTMIAPSFTLHYPNGNTSTLTADTGQGFHASIKDPLKKLVLIDHVMINHQGHSQWELFTDRADYFPATDLATTDAPVIVKGPSLVIEGKGMRAYLNEHRVELTENVKSHYAQL